jgi:hypothetical protein
MGTSKLLFNKSPLVIDPDLAVLLGLNESIIIQQIHYWLQINEKSNHNFYDGHCWTYNTYKEWQKQFPFLSVKTIQRTINNLESCRLIVSSNYNKMKIDRTKWYRIDYKILETLEESPFGHIDRTNKTEWLKHLDRLTNAIPESSSENPSENNKGILPTGENPMQFKDFTKDHKEEILLDTVIPAVEYYLTMYEETIGRKHPALKKDQWSKVVAKILCVKLEYQETYLELDEFELTVNRHFITIYDNCDYNILHFLSGDIMKNRFYEAVGI